MNKIKNSLLFCNFTCLKEKHIDGVFVIPQKVQKCPKGFSEIQMMALSIIKSYDGILSYWQITELINQVYQQKFKETAVRGAMDRLYKHDFLLREHIRKGAIQGNKYSLKTDPCVHIKKLPIVDSFVYANMENVMESEGDSTKRSMQDFQNTLSFVSQEEKIANATIDQSDEALQKMLLDSVDESM